MSCLWESIVIFSYAPNGYSRSISQIFPEWTFVGMCMRTKTSSLHLLLLAMLPCFIFCTEWMQPAVSLQGKKVLFISKVSDNSSGLCTWLLRVASCEGVKCGFLWRDNHILSLHWSKWAIFWSLSFRSERVPCQIKVHRSGVLSTKLDFFFFLQSMGDFPPDLVKEEKKKWERREKPKSSITLLQSYWQWMLNITMEQIIIWELEITLVIVHRYIHTHAHMSYCSLYWISCWLKP